MLAQRDHEESVRVPRVVVCDDSPFMRRLIAGALEGMDVVATVGSALEAVSAVRAYQPDVLTLDLELGTIDGLEVLRAVRDLPVKVIVVSAFTTNVRSERAVDALVMGAVDCIGKPGVTDSMAEFADGLRERVLALCTTDPGASDNVSQAPEPAGRAADAIFVLGASTGGPRALGQILTALPADFPAPILVVQHMPAAFSTPFVRRLAAECKLEVVEALEPTAIRPGRVIVSSSGKHLHIDGDVAHARVGAPVRGHTPALDVTLVDAALAYGPGVRAAVLTGIGRDGLSGAQTVVEHGGSVVAEDSSTCSVYGMARAVLDAGYAQASIPITEMAEWMQGEVRDA